MPNTESSNPRAPMQDLPSGSQDSTEGGSRDHRAGLDNRLDGVVIGLVLNVADAGPEVVFPGNLSDTAISARATVPLTREDIGAEVALMFEGGDPTRPIVLGKLMRAEIPTIEEADAIEVEVDGQPATQTITGDRKIVLRCGKASITLTREGKILLRGTYISSRSSGMNRVKGGSVSLN